VLRVCVDTVVGGVDPVGLPAVHRVAHPGDLAVTGIGRPGRRVLVPEGGDAGGVAHRAADPGAVAPRGGAAGAFQQGAPPRLLFLRADALVVALLGRVGR